MKTKTNDEIDEMIKEYIYESPDGGKTVYRRMMGEKDKELVDTNPTIDIGADINISSDYSDYSDLVSVDTIDMSGLFTSASPSTITINSPYKNNDVTMEIDGKQRSMRELFSTVDAISKRLAVLEPKKHLLDKYEVLQDLYEQYKAAEALLYEDEEEEFPF